MGMLRKTTRAWGFLALTLVGCAGADDLSGDETVGESRAELGECTSFSQSFYSVNGEDNVRLKPLSTHLCWLTKSSGDFDGGYNRNGLLVYVQSDQYWHLESTGGGGIGEARCTPRSCFSGDGVDDVMWISEGNAAIANRFSGDTSCDKWTTAAWWGTAATMLMGHPGPGRTAGGGEYSNVTLSYDPWKSSTVNAGDCVADNKPIFANAVSVFVGTPRGGKNAHYTCIPFSVSGNSTLPLGVRTEDAMCFFTHLTGGFRGAGESSRLYTVKNADSGKYEWYAKTTRGGAGNQIRAEGRCYYYHQWDL